MTTLDQLHVNRRQLIAGAGAASLAAAVPFATAQSPARAASALQADNQTLRFVWLGDITPLWHPAAYHTFGQAVIFTLIFNNLIKLDEDLSTVLPDLAESWEVSEDATQFTFKLRQGVTWHDGTPFTAADVVFTFSRQLVETYRFAKFMDVLQGAEEYIAGTADSVSGLVAVDDFTVEMTLSAPNALFLLSLAEPGTVIVPQHLLQDTATDAIESVDFVTSAPVGTGPYKFVQYATDQYVEMTVNPAYFKGAPSIQQMFMVRLQPEVAVAQLETKEIELALRLSPTERERLEGDPGLQVIGMAGVGLTGLQFPTDLPRMSDKRVRQGIYYAINRQGIVDAVFQGQAEVAKGNPPSMDDYEGLNPYEYNPEQARALLEEAGFDFNAPIRIIYDQNYPSAPQYYPLIGQQLQDIGLTVELNALDTVAYTERLQNDRESWEIAGFHGGAWGLGPQAVDDYYDCQDPFRTGYTNCEVDALFAEAKTIIDPAARDAKYREVAVILNDEVPRVSLWTPFDLHAAVVGLGGGFSIYRDPRRSFTKIETWTLS